MKNKAFDESNYPNWIDPNETVPYEHNAKIHTEKQIKNICTSIRRFGWQQDTVITSDNVLVIGHGRREAAIRLGCRMPFHRVDKTADELTEADIRELRIADNQTNAETGFNLDELKIDLADLSFDDFDFDFGLGSEEEQADAIEDNFDTIVPKQPRAKLGDIYQLGDHRLMCGDSSSAECVQLLMGGVQADMVFTDPPYGVAIGDKNATLNSVQKAGRCCENIENDTLSEEELYEVLKAAFINVRQSCKEDAVYFVTSPQGGSLGGMMMMMRDAGLPVRHVLMWKKNSPTFSIGRLDYDYQHEPIFYTWANKHHNYRGGQFRTTVWEFDKPRKSDLHPTMKPVALVVNAILDGSKEGDIVLDVFGGSGTTIIAAEQTKRKAYMMELDPHYVDVIIDRWESFIGKKAVLLT